MFSTWGWHGQICVLDWSLCDNSENSLGDKIWDRETSQDALVIWQQQLGQRGRALEKRFVCEEWERVINEVSSTSDVEAGIMVFLIDLLPSLLSAYALLWRCREFSFNLGLWRHTEVKTTDSGVKQTWAEDVAQSLYLPWYYFSHWLTYFGQDVNLPKTQILNV